MNEQTAPDYEHLATLIKEQGRALGFQQVGISDIDLHVYGERLEEWLALGFHGEMAYMQRHGHKRYEPAELIDGTCRIISVRMDYWPDSAAPAEQILDTPDKAYISRYALGRDYHKVLRARLKKLYRFIESLLGSSGHRVFVDSAPVLEKAIAEKAGLGWIGKHTNILNERTGSWFFLGEIYTDLPLPVDTPATNHCGSCHACIDICPTQAIVAPYKLDARRCISYLTIELRGSIPVEFRSDIGNRIYGCDDCQLVCPWNKFAQASAEIDFKTRHQLDDRTLLALFKWDEATFLQRTEGSAIRRIGYECWMRNIAVALGNSGGGESIISALQHKINCDSDLIKEHCLWALEQLR